MTIQQQMMAKRTAAGLILVFKVPGRADLFTCFPKDEASKVEWLKKAAAKGWERH